MNAAPQNFHLDHRAAALAEAGAGNPDDLIDTRAVAAWLGVSHQWCETARQRGVGPPFIRVTPRRVRYKRSDVLAWLRERTLSTTR